MNESNGAIATFDVVIVGAGPVGLLLGNILASYGIRVFIAEVLPELIDYPRGVAIDDESLRTFQAAGLIDKVLPHVTHHQAMRFVNGKGRVFASIDPRTDEFGWPRRSTFIQPLVDRVSAEGLKRFRCVTLATSHALTQFTQDADGVLATMQDGAASTRTIRSQYLIGCDGGRSSIREALGLSFTGKTDANRWIVVDIADDPLGLPNAYLHADPVRPYACIALPHGLRRLEFMLFDNEGADGQVPRDVLNNMLARVVPDPARLNIIRARVYTHNGRIAEHFRKGRVLLAGDAAHIMPVWQGQGFNSGVRDAFNLAWKLALVAKGICSDKLLDTYEQERKAHAQAMISLSQTAGAVLAMRNPIKVWARDTFARIANLLPPVKRYFLEMRFKPMPRYRDGALYFGPKGFEATSPVGKLFIQPRVGLPNGWQGLLDNQLGNGFALLSWGVKPTRWMNDRTCRILKALDTQIIWVVTMSQLAFEAERHGDVMVLGDLDGRLKQWFGQTPKSMALLRPDRFVALNCGPQELDEQVQHLALKLGFVEYSSADITAAPSRVAVIA